MTEVRVPQTPGRGVMAARCGLLRGELVGPVCVRFAGGIVVDVQVGAPAVRMARQLGVGDQLDVDTVLTPGLVDVQVNGAAGVDLVAADAEGWRRVTDHLAAHGVTSFCPTAISAPVPTLVAFARRCTGFDGAHESHPRAPSARTSTAHTASTDAVTARSLGAHLEGPFLSPEAAGAHPVERLHPASDDERTQLLGAASDLAYVTLAPELDGAIELIGALTRAGVDVSMGHTRATLDEARRAVDAGATIVTHLFNAMSPLHHREPGLPGLALTDTRVSCGLIVDGLHVADEVVRLAFTAAAGRIVLVSDSIAAAGLPPGAAHLGRATVTVGDDGAARTADGRLAGSTISLDQAVRRCIGIGVEPAVALEAATAAPARALGRRDIGHLALGARADLVRWSSTWHAVDVVAGGARNP